MADRCQACAADSHASVPSKFPHTVLVTVYDCASCEHPLTGGLLESEALLAGDHLVGHRIADPRGGVGHLCDQLQRHQVAGLLDRQPRSAHGRRSRQPHAISFLNLLTSASEAIGAHRCGQLKSGASTAYQ